MMVESSITLFGLTTSQVISLAEVCKKHSGEDARIAQFPGGWIEVEFIFPNRYRIMSDGYTVDTSI